MVGAVDGVAIVKRPSLSSNAKLLLLASFAHTPILH